MLLQKSESVLHKSLVTSLSGYLTKIDCEVNAVDGVTQNKPGVVNNDGTVGDGENKIPDIDAYVSSEQRVIRGEAKCGNGDIDSLHSITQYQLFSSRSKNGVSSLLYVIVPRAKEPELNQVLADNLSPDCRSNVKVVTHGLF